MREVCAQAQESTALFWTYTLRRTDNFHLWDEAHCFNGLSVAPRIRKLRYRHKGRMWSEHAPLVYHPLIVLGHMLSAATLLNNLQSPDPKSEVLQLNQLLQTTAAAAGSVVAKAQNILCAMNQPLLH